MSATRVILDAAPTPGAMERAALLLNGAALMAAGHEAVDRGRYEPAEVSRRASELVASWVDAVTAAAPLEQRTARMVASALDLAGIACHVEPRCTCDHATGGAATPSPAPSCGADRRENDARKHLAF